MPQRLSESSYAGVGTNRPGPAERGSGCAYLARNRTDSQPLVASECLTLPYLMSGGTPDVGAQALSKARSRIQPIVTSLALIPTPSLALAQRKCAYGRIASISRLLEETGCLSHPGSGPDP